jgi:hypothetical protein
VLSAAEKRKPLILNLEIKESVGIADTNQEVVHAVLNAEENLVTAESAEESA